MFENLSAKQLSDLFIDSMYAAIADKEIPAITGFGNGVDRGGSAYIQQTLNTYPVLLEYMQGVRSVENGYTRYAKYMEAQSH